MIPRIVFYPLLAGRGTVLRAVVVLSLVLGFLYYIYSAPFINKYYLIDTVEESNIGFLVAFNVYPAPGLEREAYREATISIVSCLGSGPYVVTALQQPSVSGHSVDVAVVLDNKSIGLIAPDISSKLFESKTRSGLDGFFVEAITMAKEAKGLKGPILYLDIGGERYRLQLYEARSRIILSPSDTIVLYNTRKARELIEKLWLGSILVAPGKYIEDVKSCITKANETLVRRGFGKVSYNMYTKHDVYEQNLRTSFAEFSRVMLTSSLMSLAVSIIVSLREGARLARNSSELIGLLRLYGASIRLALLVGLVNGFIVSLASVIGLLLIARIVFAVFLPVRLPPIGYMVYATRLFILGSLTSIVLSVTAGFSFFATRSKLEELIVAR